MGEPGREKLVPHPRMAERFAAKHKLVREMVVGPSKEHVG
jgi:hypothetical protein